MTDTPDANKHDMPPQTLVTALRRRWGMGLLAVCLLAVGVYVFFLRAGEAPSRAATPRLTVVLYLVVPKGFFPVQDTGVIQGISDVPQFVTGAG
jgi:hypothetical protein